MQLRIFAGVVIALLIALNAYAAAPTITSLVMNSTFGVNSTYHNLTAYVSYSDADSDNVTIAYDWRINGSSFATFIYTFDTNDSGGTGKTLDFSRMNQTATASGAFWNISGGINNTGAYYFDGNDDYIIVPHNKTQDMVTGQNYTIMLWIKTPGGFPFLYGRVISKHPTGLDMGIYHIRVGYNNYPPAGDVNDFDRVEFEIGNSSGYYIDVKSATAVTDNQWHHVVAMRNGSSITLFIDGVFENTTNISSNFLDLPSGSSNNDLFIGGGGPSIAEYFKGHIDDVRFYNRSFSAAEIAAIYQNKSYLIINTSLKAGENWTLCATPQDKTGVGATNCTSTLLILPACTPPATNTNWVMYAENRCIFNGRNITIGTGILTITGNGIVTLTNTNISAANISIRNRAQVSLYSRSRLNKG